MSFSPEYHTEIIGVRPIITSRSTDTEVLRKIGPWRLKTPPRQRSKSEGRASSTIFEDESYASVLSFSETIQKIDEECAIIKEAQDQEQKLRDNSSGYLQTTCLACGRTCHALKLSKKQICDLLLTFLESSSCLLW